MLSYRHAYHAGNHADVLKHFTLYTILNYYNQKDKPYWYIDTHAGAGLYDLHSSEANKVGEYQQGIARLWAVKGQPENHHPSDKGQPENQFSQSTMLKPILASQLRCATQAAELLCLRL